MIQRYTPINTQSGEIRHLYIHENGDYVLYSDYEKEYAALWRECEGLSKEVFRLRTALEMVEIENQHALTIARIAKEALGKDEDN